MERTENNFQKHTLQNFFFFFFEKELHVTQAGVELPV